MVSTNKLVYNMQEPDKKEHLWQLRRIDKHISYMLFPYARENNSRAKAYTRQTHNDGGGVAASQSAVSVAGASIIISLLHICRIAEIICACAFAGLSAVSTN